MSKFTNSDGSTIFVRQNGTNIESSFNKTNWREINWPVDIINNGSDYLIIEFTTDINITNPNQYFSCKSDRIQFGVTKLQNNGTRPNIIISTNNYQGFIENGTENTNGYNHICVYNLIINATQSNESGAGWIGRKYFGVASINNYIVHCSSNGEIGENGGGIVGQFAGSSSGNLTIIGSSSSGVINNKGGGIVGSSAGVNGGNVTCNSCFSNGLIKENAGGIFGEGSTIGTIVITNCYTTGNIETNGGGISGKKFGANTGSATIQHCYTTGDIDSTAGGIVAGLSNNITITNCYTTGNVIGYAGGCIAGALGGTININNCYTVGNGFNNQGIVQGYIKGNSTLVPDTCYSETKNGTSGSWDNIHANSVLIGTPIMNIGSLWISTGINVPYKLLNIGSNPYSLNNIKIVNDIPLLYNQFSQYIIAGKSSIKTIHSDFSENHFSILQKDDSIHSYDTITIHPQTGMITTTSDTNSGSYPLYIYNTRTECNTLFTLIVKKKIVFNHHFHLFSNNDPYYNNPSSNTSISFGVRNSRFKNRK
jgi:hypothetical protein